MITRGQHDKFLERVRNMRSKGFQVFINAQKVVKIDDKAIYTTNYEKVNGQYQRVRYSFEESVQPYMTLQDLYRKVEFRISLLDVYWDLDFRDVGAVEWSLGHFNKDINLGSEQEIKLID